jgi:hypothetical protein
MSFHNELMFYLTMISTFVLIFLLRVIYYFTQEKAPKDSALEFYF